MALTSAAAIQAGGEGAGPDFWVFCFVNCPLFYTFAALVRRILVPVRRCVPAGEHVRV